MSTSYGPSGNSARLIAEAKTLYGRERGIAAKAGTNDAKIRDLRVAMFQGLITPASKRISFTTMDWNSNARHSIDALTNNLNLSNSITTGYLDTTMINTSTTYGRFSSLYQK
jgi:hypothetical protein